jgi:tetratricopeptide (TPR) repeat protein/serine phosphatase RsbU (regulator of sigma subunit)
MIYISLCLKVIFYICNLPLVSNFLKIVIILYKDIVLTTKCLRLYLLAIILSTGFLSYGQSSRIDSLSKLYRETSNDTLRVSLLFELGNCYTNSNADTALWFYKEAWGLTKSKNLDTLDFLKIKAASYSNLGLSYRKLGSFHQALVLQEESLRINIFFDDKLSIARVKVNIGNIFFNLGNFDVSLNNYYEALLVYESLNDRVGIADCHNNIGSVYKEMEDFDRALEHHYKSVEVFENLLLSADTTNHTAMKRGLSYGFNNIGVALWSKGNSQEAIEYYQKSLEIKRENNDKNGVAQGYNNIAIVYATDGSYEESINYFQQSLNLYTQTQNLNGLAMVNGNIAYLNILLSEKPEGGKSIFYLKKSLESANKSFEISEQIGALPFQIEAAGYLKTAYSRLGNSEKALVYANKYIEIQKEIFSKEKANAIAETASRYEVEKQQLLIKNMENEKLLFQKTIDIQKIVIISGSILMLLLFTLTIILVKYNKRKKRANNMLSEQNEEILQQKEEIIAQLDEIEIQKREIEQLYLIALERKNVLERQRDNINDSIRYAKFIQSAVLPDLHSVFKEAGFEEDSFFILYRPKDVVSGDFYWATLKNDWLVAAVADCTGHGVPGSLMSMLGVSFLNEIVVKNGIVDPAEILENLRNYIIESLKQSGEGITRRDGMEMSIIAINRFSMECFWAGANNPLWIVRKGNQNINLSMPENNIEELKPDLMPVAVHIKMTPFKNTRFFLDKGDRLFLFSDGYGDQFGGLEGKKFNMHSAFKRLLVQTSSLPIVEQGEVIESNFDAWINIGGSRFEQTDDVTVFGILV